MAGTIEQIYALLKKYPDTPNRRKILTLLSDVDEQLNGFLFGIAETQGYSFGNLDGTDRHKVISKED